MAGGLLAYLGFEGAGYDIVVRQQVALGVWAALAIGFAFGVLPRATLRRTLLIPGVALLALLLWMVLSLGWTGSDERTVGEIARVLGYAGLMALAIASLNRHTFAAAAAGVSVAAFAVIGVAVASRLSPSTFPQALDVIALFGTPDRLTFPLDYWNAVGTWGAMAGVIGLAWSAHASSAVVRGISLAFVPVAGLAVYLTYSRGGVVASAAAIVAVLVLSRNRWTVLIHLLAALGGAALAITVARGQVEIAEATGGRGGGDVALALLGAAAICVGAVVLTSVLRADDARLPRKNMKLLAPVLIGAILIVFLVGLRGPISNAWNEFRFQDQPAVGNDPTTRLTTAGGNRNDLWNSAIDAFEENPVQGIGPGTFEFWWQSTADDAEYVMDGHSLYLEQMAEVGLPGLILLLVFLGGSLFAALQARRTLTDDAQIGASVAMCSAFIVFLVSAGLDWMWEETAVGAMALGGIAVAAAAGSSRQRTRKRRGVLRYPWVRPMIVIAAVIAGAVQAPGLISNERIRDSEDQLAAGDLTAARTSAEDAITAAPWAASPREALANVERRAGEFEAARREIEQAVMKEPDNWRWPLVLAPIQVDLGERATAIETFREGRSLAPNLEFYSPFSEFGRQVYKASQLKRIFFRQQAKGVPDDA